MFKTKNQLRLLILVAFFGLLYYRLFSPNVSRLAEESQKTEIRLESFLIQVRGVKKIQVAELDQLESISQESRKKVLWNRFELPSVVVAVKVPVSYTYYLDLEKPWSVVEQGGRLKVTTPPIQFNPPAPDISA
ncbi:MAG: hypothetical protein AAF203_07825, partial [Pseudomonadota bacterium]